METLDTTGIGQQIRDLRKARGITLEALARQIDKSTAWVSLVERNRTELSISSLKGIAEALGMQISWFFQAQGETPERERPYIVRRDNRRQLALHSTGMHEELLSPGLNGESELVMTTFQPGASGGETVERDAEECGLVLEGRLGLSIGDEEFELGAGDSFTIPRGSAHRSWNPGEQTTRVVWVITPPSY